MKNIVLLAAIAFTLYSCGGGSSTTTTSEKVKITILGENSATIQSMMALEADYEKQNPNIDLDFKPNSFDEAFTKSNQDFVNGTGLYDIVLQYNFSLSSFVRNNYVYSLDELLNDVPDSLKSFEKDLYDYSWKEVGYYYKNQNNPSEGFLKVGYPFASNSMVLMYNKTMFEDEKHKAAYKAKHNEELQIPTTWAQFVKVASFFTQPENGIHGVCLQGAEGGWLYYEFLNFLSGSDGKVMDKQYGWQGDENTKVLLNTPQTIEAIKIHKSLKPFNAGNFTNVDQSEQMLIMKKGKTAMAIVWSDLIYSTIKTNEGFDSTFGFSTVPGTKSVLGGGAYFVNKKSKNPKEVALYISNIMQQKTQIALAKKGLCSALKTVYDDPEVQKIPYTDAMKKSLERGSYMIEAGPDADMISKKITTYLQKVWNDELTPEQAAQKMQSEIEAERKSIFAAIK